MASKKRERRDYCSIINCKKQLKGNIIFHKFPKNEELKKIWISRCNITKNVTKHSMLCSLHFTKEDYYPIGSASKIFKLKKEAIASQNLTIRKEVFTPNILKKKKSNKIVNRSLLESIQMECKKRTEGTLSKVQSIQSLGNTKQDEPINKNKQGSVVEESDLIKNLINKCDSCNGQNDSIINTAEDSYKFTGNRKSNIDAVIACVSVSIDEENGTLNAEEPSALEEISLQNADADVAQQKILSEIEPKLRTDLLKNNSMNLMFLIKNDDQLITFTGINHSLLSSLTAAVILCEKKHYTNKFSNSVQDRIVLCLSKLRLNLPFSCLAVLFGLNRKSCAKNVYYMIQLLSTILKKVIYWPSKEEIMKSMPKCFKNFKQTRIVLDCTEIPVERPTCLKCRLKLYSHYKGCETVKLLIGVAPSGLITFLSEAYGGRAFDKTIFNQSKIIDKMDATRDAIMVDKGFNIEMECLENNVQLIIPPKLGKNIQLNADEVAHTIYNKIAAARVHVERAIQRFKMFKIVKCKISWTLIPYIDDICTIIAGLTNLKNPILADDKF